MVEKRDSTSTEGKGLGHSWADDNVERGEEGVDFIKRRPTYPLGDNPRGREIDFQATDTDEAYGSTRNPIVRAYRGRAPLEGQDFVIPKRLGSLDTIQSLRPGLPDRTVSSEALDVLKEQQRATLLATNFGALFPIVTIDSPAPGATFSPGDQIIIRATVEDLRGVFSATLQIDGQSVDRQTVDPRDRDSTLEKQFGFTFNIPAAQALGSMDITVRGFNIATSFQGMIADDAPDTSPEIDQAVGTLDGRLGQSDGTQANPPLLQKTGILRTPEGVSSISVNIV